jgi:membrane protein
MDTSSTLPGQDRGWLGVSHHVGVLRRWIAMDRASQMASALAYRTLLGLLPVLVVATLVFKTIAGERFGAMVGEALSGLGLDKLQIQSPDGKSAGPVQLSDWLRGIIEDAAKLDLSALGWVGAGVLIFSAVWVVATIEDCFNLICRTDQSRSWPKRVVTYWFALTAGPLLLALVPLVGSMVEQAATALPNWSWLLGSVRVAWATLVLWALMFAVYLTVPSQPPRWRAAAAGALLSAIGLELCRSFLHFYVSRTLSLSLVYGSLGLVPVFMFWMYVIWLVVLVGLQVAVLWDALDRRGLDGLLRNEGGSGS